MTIFSGPTLIGEESVKFSVEYKRKNDEDPIRHYNLELKKGENFDDTAYFLKMTFDNASYGINY